MPMKLEDEEQDILAGKFGAASQEAIRRQIKVGERRGQTAAGVGQIRVEFDRPVEVGDRPVVLAPAAIHV